MEPISEENSIIKGLVDSFCLACDIHLLTEGDISKHIENPKHNKSKTSNPFVHQNESHLIRKFKYGYFCSNCNVLLHTLTTVNFHVKNIENSNKTKDKSHIKRIDNSVIAFDDILISEQAWHGIIGDTCVLCDMEFEDANDHKNEPVHLLHLIQGKIIFDINKTIYRQLEDNCSQCLTCNMLVASSKIQEHFNDLDHERSYQRFIKSTLKTNTNDKDNKVKNNNNVNDYSNLENNKDENHQKDAVAISKMREMDLKYHKIILEKEEKPTNSNNKKKLVTNVIEQEEEKAAFGNDLNYEKEVNNIIEEQKKKKNYENDPKILVENFTEEREKEKNNDNNEKALVKSIVPSASTSDVNENEETFAKLNSITYNRGNHTAYCRICCSRLPSNPRSLKEHVNGIAHKKNVARKETDTKLNKNQHKSIGKQSFFDFLDSLHIEAIRQRDVVVNAKFCISKLSFYLVSKHGFRYRCQVCEMNLTMNEVDIHMEMPSHQLAMKDIPVLVSFSSEFIREVRPGLFHCGYCNLIEGSRENLDNHLKCTIHLQKRSLGESRIPGFLRDMCMRSVFERIATMSFLSRVFGNREAYDSDDSF